MSTIGDALSAVEAGLFVDRSNELKCFEQWLTTPRRETDVLNVNGPAGIGKSALLRAFGRIAVEHGRTVVYLNIQEAGAAPEALLGPFCDPRGEPLVVSLGRRRLVLLLDAVRARTSLSRYLLGTLLPRLVEGTKVVIAGREALATQGEEGDLWRLMIQPMSLGGVSDADARIFLSRRGLIDPAAQDSIMRVADGNPLALSLAVNLTLRSGQSNVTSSPEWLLITRDLAQRLLDEIEEPELRPLVSACAVIGPFDEGVLAAISPHLDTTTIFNRLSRLSMVRATRQGLILQPQARRILANDLRWRWREEYRALRAWARARSSRTTPAKHPPPSPPALVAQTPAPLRRDLADVPPLTDAVAQLTRREREVLGLLAAGRLSNREIAAKLVISLGTANLHVKHILHKLGFVNRTELVVWWVQRERRVEKAI